MAPPQTGGEKRGGMAYSTLAEIDDFIAQCAADSPRVAYTTTDKSYQGRDIHVVRIGYPTAPSLDDAVKPSMHIGTVHGDEEAGQEGLLQLIRELAYTDDPDLIDYLTNHTVVVMPCVNPDGQVAQTRVNAQGRNINREHLSLRATECEVVQRVFARVQPEVFIDHHERNAAQTGDFLFGWMTNPNVDPGLASLSRTIVDDVIRPYIEANTDYTTGYYTFPDDAGANGGVATNTAGLRHAVGLLFETWGIRPIAERAEQQLLGALKVLDYHRTSGATIDAAIAASKANKVAEGQNRSRPFDLDGTNVDPPPLGYHLDADALAASTVHREVFGITHAAGHVTLAQEAQPVIPYLFDLAAPYRVAAGTRVGPAEGDPQPGLNVAYDGTILPVTDVRIRLDGALLDVTQIRHRQDGQTVDLWSGH